MAFLEYLDMIKFTTKRLRKLEGKGMSDGFGNNTERRSSITASTRGNKKQTQD